MDSISSWAAVICIAAVICGVLELLNASPKMDKVLRFVFGGFMLCAIIVPLSDIDIDFNALPNTDDFFSESTVEETVNTGTVSVVTDKISALVNESLTKINVTAQKVDIDMDIDKDNCINMITVILKLQKSDAEREQEIRTLITQDLGLPCEISY